VDQALAHIESSKERLKMTRAKKVVKTISKKSVSKVTKDVKKEDSVLGVIPRVFDFPSKQGYDGVCMTVWMGFRARSLKDHST
jgi:hypothetical protein